jgi:putative two-component system response regulator
VKSVLVVDDERRIRSLVSRWARSDGYSVTEAPSAEDALEEMTERPAAIAVCDIRMPNHDGLWLAEQLRKRFPATALIMATGVLELDAAVLSLRTRAVDYLSKPFTRMQLQMALERGVVWHRDQVANRSWQRRLQTELRRRQAQVTERLTESAGSPESALGAILAMLENRTPDVYKHSQRVADLATKLGRTMGITGPALLDIEHAALLHDIGKIAVPQAILNKPAELTPEEWEVMRQHINIAYDLLSNVATLRGASEIVRSSRQWFEEQCHAARVCDSDVELASRVVAVADAFDSMTHTQPYRAAMLTAGALTELGRRRGTQFDPAVVDALSTVVGTSPRAPSDPGRPCGMFPAPGAEVVN